MPLMNNRINMLFTLYDHSWGLSVSDRYIDKLIVIDFYFSGRPSLEMKINLEVM